MKIKGCRITMDWQVVYFIISFSIKPIFSQLYYHIQEDLKQGFVIGNIAKDLGLNAKELSLRNFHIVPRGKIQYFAVNFENGDLYIAERIDREMLCEIKQNCVLSFEAVIEHPLHLYPINVEIEDINDNPPSFSKNIFDIVISEAAIPGAHLPLGHAQDPDLGTNSVQDYTISKNEYFKLGIKMTNNGIKSPELILEKNSGQRKTKYS